MKISIFKLRFILTSIFIILVCELIDIISQNYALLIGTNVMDGQFPFVWYFVYGWDKLYVSLDLSEVASLLLVLYVLFLFIFSKKIYKKQYVIPLVFACGILMLEFVDFFAKLLATNNGSYENTYHSYFFIWKRYRDINYVWFLNLANIFLLVSAIAIIIKYIVDKKKVTELINQNITIEEK